MKILNITIQAICRRALMLATTVTLLATGVLSSCDTLSVSEILQLPPSVATVTPTTGSIGSEIVITGSNLNDVVSATIGEGKAEIYERVSDQRISLRVLSTSRTGKITLANANGTCTTTDDFVVTYPAPSLNLSQLPADVEMSGNMLISGANLSVAENVLFRAKGHTENHPATIVSQHSGEILLKVPFVEANEASIIFEYFDGHSMVQTEAMPEGNYINVKRYEPRVTSVSATSAAVGDIITIRGEYLTKIDRLMLGDTQCQMGGSDTEMTFPVPTSQSFVDGDNQLPLWISYFDERSTTTLCETFTVKVPYVYFWADKKIYGQGRDVEELTSFFSPETGQAYANSDWRTIVDPISYQYQANTCSAAQTPKVSQQEYESVNPYFFFSGVSAGNLQLNSPAGSTGQLKNFYWFNNSANDYRVTGANSNCYGTPVMTFMYLDPTNADHQPWIEMVKNGSIEKIDETTFPINTEAKTIGGVSVSLSNTCVSTSFAKEFTVGQNDEKDIDSYILVVYYNHKGKGTNPTENIKRIGFMHIKHIKWQLYNNTAAPSSSAITFDMYWQKHDYK